MISFLGKFLLIEEDEKKVLVVGDLHVGYERELNKGGIDVSGKLQEELISEFENVFTKTGKITMVVLLGDVKHYFGRNVREEWFGLRTIFTYLKKKSEKVIIIRGNHDTYLMPLASKENIEVKDIWKWRKYCFIHGDKDFEELYDKEVGVWIMGHVHPAIFLHEGVKQEKYKCYLIGRYEGKEVIILPSFFSGIEGSDVRERVIPLPWKFNWGYFTVKVVEKLRVLDFGLLKRIK